MKDMVRHYDDQGMTELLDDLIPHLDVMTLDLHQVVCLSRQHRLCDALIFVFNKGMSDYITPIEAFEDLEQDEQAIEFHQRMIDILLQVMLESTDFSPSQIGSLFTFLARQLAKAEDNLFANRQLFHQVCAIAAAD
ncbi:vacuolar protein sorting-associated protein 8 homolog [Anguilla rostrata]|uniref:vacuolar protein sorting-associated protein 8 homolog n=1 Tax=Anguilla rostrata TaxID=7938 RepID=UPI0030CAABFC